MKTSKRIETRLRAGLLALAGACASLGAAAWEPSKPIEFVVPAGTGGGADQMARFIQGVAAKNKLTTQPIVVVNKSGGAGAEGFLDVKNDKGNPHKIIITLARPVTGLTWNLGATSNLTCEAAGVSAPCSCSVIERTQMVIARMTPGAWT